VVLQPAGQQVGRAGQRRHQEGEGEEQVPLGPGGRWGEDGGRPVLRGRAAEGGQQLGGAAGRAAHRRPQILRPRLEPPAAAARKGTAHPRARAPAGRVLRSSSPPMRRKASVFHPRTAPPVRRAQPWTGRARGSTIADISLYAGTRTATRSPTMSGPEPVNPT